MFQYLHAVYRKQCDEDDYGFASKTSMGLYEKLMSKYEADPEDPMAKFSRAQPKVKWNLNGDFAYFWANWHQLNPGEERLEQCQREGEGGFEEGARGAQRTQKAQVCKLCIWTLT